MEDYKEKYEYLIKRIKHFHETVSLNWKRIIESHVPEVKEESEDERIRKELIEHIKTNRESGFILFQKISPDEVIAWLEKQGKPIDEEEILIGARKRIALSIMDFLDRNTLGMCLSSMECKGLEDAVVGSDWRAVYNYMKKKLEKQGEQKPTDTAEPKFHEGEWITNGIDVDKIIGIDLKDKNYLFENGRKSDFSLVENISHVWTINDAKDGDVLAFDDDNIVIFKNLYNSTSFHSYCHIEDGIFDFNDECLFDWWNGEGFKPATQKQRDLLFSKMKEAGYKWDTEKKELKKIEQKSTDKTELKFHESD